MFRIINAHIHCDGIANPAERRALRLHHEPAAWLMVTVVTTSGSAVVSVMVMVKLRAELEFAVSVTGMDAVVPVAVPEAVTEAFVPSELVTV